MEDIANIYVSFSTILFKNIMMKNSNIYVSINGYLLQEIIIHWCRKNSQHSMVSLTIFNNILIYTWQQKKGPHLC